ncbi:hypothetical protein BS78_07G218200 [Paspalum vaginatum]|nr:hypothetical protein BS78_07G218200 [Paspalum vaginatum]
MPRSASATRPTCSETAIPAVVAAGTIVPIYLQERFQNKRSSVTNPYLSRYNKPKKTYTIEVFSYDYVCNKQDESIIQYIASQPLNKTLVDIDGAFCTRSELECLFNDTSYVNDDAEEHLSYRDGGKVFLENTFISSILKRDGHLNVGLISLDNDTIEKRVVNYLEHDMVFFPINIKNSHWYLGVVNARECEVHVLDSLGEGVGRVVLAETVVGLQRQISIVAKTKELKNHMWRDLQVANWPIIEKITEPMQTDGRSCGLFMINYMEYWTGTQLSDNVTQDDMKNISLKLMAFLWDSELNTRKACSDSELDDNKGEKNSCEVEILDEPPNVLKKKNSDVVSISNTLIGEEEFISAIYDYIKSINNVNTLEFFRQKLCAIKQETNTHALSIRSMPVGKQELRDEICNYIMTIDHDQALDAKKIQEILRKDQAMDVDCFNLAVRSLAFEELQGLKRSNKSVSKHYMDLKFSIVIPCAKEDKFLLFVLDLNARIVSILDPSYDQRPLGAHMLKTQRIFEVLRFIMEVKCPGWSENAYPWDHRIPNGAQIRINREETGYFVLLFMHAWNGESLQTPICMDAYELRKHVLTFKGNQCESNVPKAIWKYLRRYISLTNRKV